MSEKYNYEEEMLEDIIEYFKQRDYGHITNDMRDDLYDKLWINDSVTGNGSGSYTFSSFKAEEYICHNLDLLEEVEDELGFNNKRRWRAEYLDVSIRCYLLGQVLDDAIKEWNEEHEEEEE